MPEQDQWTNDLRAAWLTTWMLPHMQIGRAILAEHARLKPTPAVLPPGYDLRDYAAASFNHALGQADILEKIEDMCREKRVKKQLRPEDEYQPPAAG